MYDAKRRIGGRGLGALVAVGAVFFSLSFLRADDAARPEVPEAYRDADAIVLHWEETWTKSNDGTVTYRESKRTLIQDGRAIRACGDVRVAYHGGYQTVKILTARTHCADGRVIDVPEYSMNEVSPRNSAGWPAFAPIRAKVISFSGIEPGAILELAYERTTKPGMHRYLEIECRLHDTYPTLLRRIQFPDGKPAREFENLDGVPDEPQGIPWRDGTRHVWYSDCPDERTWARSVLDGLEQAAKPVSAFTSTVEEWTKDASDPTERAGAIQEKLKKRLSIIGVHPSLTGDRLRTANDVLASHYASKPEATALLLSLFRAAGLKAEPFFAVEEEAAGWVTSAVTEYGVKVIGDSETSYWHVTDGRIRDPGPWGGWKRYDTAFASDETAASPARFRSHANSRLFVNAIVKLDEKASWTAELTVRASGLFLSGDSLQTEDGKKKAVRDILNRTLPEAELKSFTVTTLSDDAFAVSASAASKEPLAETDGHIFFELPKDGPWTKRVPIPLNRSVRKTPLRLTGPFRQELIITLEYPSAWSVAGRPIAVQHLLRNQRSVHQSMTVEGRRMTVHQGIEIDGDVSPQDYGGVRNALNDLRSRRARTVILSRSKLSKDEGDES